MRSIIAVLFLLNAATSLVAQNGPELSSGTVTYLTSQRVYVRFASTEGLREGDTLFLTSDKGLLPALKVYSLSSTSCVCDPLGGLTFAVGQTLVTDRIRKNPVQEEPVLPKESQEKQVIPDVTDTIIAEKKPDKQRKQHIRGRLSAASYTDLSDMTDNRQRMRYGMSINASNIKDSRLSAEAYLSLAIKDKRWENDSLERRRMNYRIYNLALNYALSDKLQIWAGRKVNPRMANMGAVDGFQFELRHQAFTSGILLGSRPDSRDYGFNGKLLQYGAYLSHDFPFGKQLMQNTLAFAEQKNDGKTDRRFLYYQHNSQWFRVLNFFGSAEIDLYKSLFDSTDLAEKADHSPNLTNLYLSLRANPFRSLSLSLSYSERQSIIYYETYRDIVQQLLDAGATKGYRFQASYRPWKRLSLGLHAGYRFRDADPRDSKNLYTYLTYNSLPWLDAAFTVSFTGIESPYLKGKVYSAGLSRSLFSDKANLGLVYRRVDYSYEYSGMDEIQQIGELSLDLRVYRKLSLGLNYEGTLAGEELHHRIYAQLSQRF